ncbi:Alpha/Beta hydrolase protein [Flagelloscypha sp. PMI_526]|nr:Alpha/Beta hydrolase protein [Flagelloscypha sp. PMI_526]
MSSMNFILAGLAVLFSFVNATFQDPFSAALNEPTSAAASGFSTFGLPQFSDYSVRIKKIDWCDHTVRSYSGYLDFRGRHMFFYYFESRRDPSEDPVMVWETGGPGGSSTLGMLTELGPCLIANSTSVKWNEYGWNAEANLLFVDQPIGVGYSYSEYSEVVDSWEAAIDMARFVAIFFEASDFGLQGRELHIAGESYGGRYVPLFAARVIDQNAELVREGLTPVNMKSVLIGNGWTDGAKMYGSFYDIQCTTKGRPLQSIETCVRLKADAAHCVSLIEASCYNHFDYLGCRAATLFCEGSVAQAYFDTGGSPYDLRKKCPADSGAYCYPENFDVDALINSPEMRDVLGIDHSFPGNFTVASWEVGRAFLSSGDTLYSSGGYLEALLERDVGVLIYAGTLDFICNWVGNLNMVNGLEFPEQAEFRTQELHEWSVDGRTVGLTKAAGRLRYATVNEAGHMVPYDQPKTSLEMVNKWLAGSSL